MSSVVQENFGLHHEDLRHYPEEYAVSPLLPVDEGIYDSGGDVVSSQWTELEAIDCGINISVSHTCFDPFEELLWTANEAGRISAFYPTFQEEQMGQPIWCKYASFMAHTDAVNQMIVEQWGVLSLSHNALRIHSKGGQLTHVFSDESMTNLLNFAYIDQGKSNLCLGGNTPQLFNYDVTQNAIVNKVDCSQGTAVVKSTGRVVCCGGISGDISLRDPRSLSEQWVIPQAHATISDLDVKGVLLVSCGFTQSMYEEGHWEPDPLVKVWDLRRPQRALASIQPHLLPYLVKFHPLFPSLLVVGQAGTLQFLDVNTLRAEGGVYQVFSDHLAQTNHITAFDISSSSEALAFGDNTGFVHTWGRKDAPIINMVSDPIEHPINPLPNVAAPVFAADGTTQLHLDETSSFGIVPIPESDEPFLSAWPSPSYMTLMGSRPKKIKATLKRSLNYREFVGHAANPSLRHMSEAYEEYKDEFPDPWPRNQAVGQDVTQVVAKLAAPPPKKPATPVKPLPMDLQALKKKTSPSPHTPEKKVEAASTKPPQPKASLTTRFRRVEIQENRLSWDDFEFGRYNRTPYRGLENVLPHSYMNAIIQSLFYLTPPDMQMRSVMLGHSCSRSFCLCCELGFLFHMLNQPHGGSGSPAQPGNFLRTIRHVADGHALFEIDDGNGTTIGADKRLMQRIQDFVRFLFPQLHQESTVETKSGPNSTKTKDDDSAGPNESKSHVEKVMAIKTATVMTCSCGAKVLEMDTQPSLYLDACCIEVGPRRRSEYGSSDKGSASAQSEEAFIAEMEDCLNSRPHMARPTPTSGYCKQCRSLQMVKSYKMVAGLPFSLTLNVNMPVQDHGAHDDPIWFLKNHLESNGSADSPNHFRAGSSSETRKYIPPPNLYIYKCFTDDRSRAIRLPTWKVRTKPNPALQHEAEEVHVYQMSSCISHIKDTAHPSREGHLVNHIRVLDSPQNSWFLFNDFCVSASSITETQCVVPNKDETKAPASTLEWQTPLVVFYNKIPQDKMPKVVCQKPDVVPVQTQRMDTPSAEQLLLFDEGAATPNNKNRGRQVSFKPLTATELPKKGDKVALDAEFVALTWDSKGSKYGHSMSVLGLARVSVCRPSGDAFLDDYIATEEPVEDYLTKWSGIVNGDLDASVSLHHITTLKNTYTKLRCLVDRGVVFVGHGLKKDFRIINLHVPKSQILDTVELFHKARQRKMSLKFLAYHLLAKRIQQETHNSIEDALVAMRLYKKYLELQEKGVFESKLTELYEVGNRDNWMIPGEGVPLPPAVSAAAAHVKRQQHYQQLMLERQQQQRERDIKERVDKDGMRAQNQNHAQSMADARRSRSSRLNTNAKPFVPPSASTSRASGLPLDAPTSHDSSLSYPGSQAGTPGLLSHQPPPQQPHGHGLFLPPDQPPYGDAWGMDVAMPPVTQAGSTSGRSTTVQQLFQQHQQLQQQQRNQQQPHQPNPGPRDQYGGAIGHQHQGYDDQGFYSPQQYSGGNYYGGPSPYQYQGHPMYSMMDQPHSDYNQNY